MIFNGTTNLPAKNFAEVSIELENFSGQISNIISNEKRVSISRTLERGVGSFYKINNKDVRAKDINVLFSDSGSGPRSSSIIGQGNIDQIINFKPIERKIILEDAAGISGLQSRRHESELKLQSTELNLEKIDINLENLHDQKRSLSRQSRQAERYEKLSQSITTLPAIRFSAHDQPTLPLILTTGPSQDPIPKYPKLPSKIRFNLFSIPTPKLCFP